MSSYKIFPRQQENAKKLKLVIKSSTNPLKKIDVFQNGKKVASIGAIKYKDYATYIEDKGIDFANKRKKLYKARHQKTRNIINTPSYFADKILWS